MEPADQTAAAARVAGDHSLPGASSHARVAVDALRRKLLKERIREEIFATKHRNSEPEVRREIRMEHAVPYHGISPVRQADRLQPHMPVPPEPRAIKRLGGVVMSRRPVKDRLSGWHRPPWHDRPVGEEAASSGWVGPPKKTFSGVKRKSTVETSLAGIENSFGNWSCALCHVNLYSEFSFMEHCADPLHQSTLAYMEWTKQTTGLKRIVTAESYPRPRLQHNPTAWSCSMCQVWSSSESELKNHLSGWRHQENAEALWRESREIGGNIWLQEAKLSQPVYKNQRYATRWNCSICKASGASEFGLENHLRGQMHQQNVKARFL